jgi:hypothetical protein
MIYPLKGQRKREVTLPLPINTLVYKVPRDHPKEFLV